MAAGASGDHRQCVARVTGKGAAARAGIVGSDGPAVSSAAQQLWGARHQAQGPNAFHLVRFCKAGVRCGSAQWALQSMCSLLLSGKWGEPRPPDKNGLRVILSAFNTFNLQQHQLLVGHCAVVGILFRQVDAPQADVAKVFFAG